MTPLRYSGLLRIIRTPVLAAVSLAAFVAAPSAYAYEGYGYQTIGGQGGSTCHVTNLSASGSGSFTNCVTNRSGARTVVFDVAGTITLGSTIWINIPYLTIDGTTAPAPGITIRPASSSQTAIAIEDTHDIIIQGLRMKGYDTENGADLIRIDAGSTIYNVVVDHVTLTGADDGAVDITGDVHDVTVSGCFLYNNNLASLVKYGSRQRISFHHNVFAQNAERNPQLQGDLTDFDFVNNIVYDWGRGGWGYGLRIRNVVSEGRVDANVVNNAFVADTGSTSFGLIYGSDPGQDSEDGGPASSPAQGTVVTTSDLGSLWVAGNILPSANKDQYSTVAAPLPVPLPAQVTTAPANQLGTLVASAAGMAHRDAYELALLGEIATALGAAPPSLSIGDVVVSEGDTGTKLASLPVSLSGPSTVTVSVAWSTANGTATAGSDYVAASGTLSFAPGATTQNVNVSVIGDTVDEGDETFFVNLSAPVNATLSKSQGQVTIQDDDTATPPTPPVAYDFDGDGSPDILLRHDTSGEIRVWMMNDATMTASVSVDVPVLPSMDWQIQGVGDFNADGHLDILWRHAVSGAFSVWFMDGTTRIGEATLNPPGVGILSWHIRAVADFNGDDKPDILWRDEWGSLYIWLMDGTSLLSGSYLNPGWVTPAWRIRGTGDFNADGKADILWQHDRGDLCVWFMDGTSILSGSYLNPWLLADPDWRVARVADADLDGYPDILWQQESTGALRLWYMVGADRVSAAALNPSQLPETPWKVVPQSIAPWVAERALSRTPKRPGGGRPTPEEGQIRRTSRTRSAPLTRD